MAHVRANYRPPGVQAQQVREVEARLGCSGLARATQEGGAVGPDLSNLMTSDNLRSYLSDAEQRKADLRRQSLQYDEEINRLERELAEVRNENTRNQADIGSSRGRSRDAKKVCRNQYELFKETTGIHWDAANPARGYIALDEVAAFDFKHFEEEILLKGCP